ncbi:hypothetical protein GCM10010840_34080 [Deinococcus aerolatus]|uniref:histidine kinase n=1 Tax=Deinococcus aerolatus TaxID=522487 RepID=A0ABQ2GF37_9DEIO|nr:PAS domain S-box protein [Deinococcus aerolatus]GGL93228.1 hypothetical protein GCM10010840_34080 [Deinococcus aerolatus]
MSFPYNGPEAHTLALLEAAQIAYSYPTWTTTLQGNVVTANAALLEYLGVGLEQLREGKLRAATHPEDQDGLLVPVAGESREMRLRRHDGQYRWFLVTPTLLEDGHAQGWIMAAVDIDGYRGRHQAAAEEQSLLQGIIDGSSDCIKVLDLDARLLSMNAGGMQVMEIEDFSACRLAFWPTFWEGDTRLQVERALQAAREGQSQVFEGAAHTFKGTLRFWEVAVSPIRDSGGTVRRLLAISRDITPRKRQNDLMASQNRLLEQIATGEPLSEVLLNLSQFIEQQSDGLLCAVQRYDARTGKLFVMSAPSLPPAYTAVIDGLSVGPDAGVCGAAVFRREPVAVVDLSLDPAWPEDRQQALAHGLRACWCFPLVNREGEIRGAFAVYGRQPRPLTPDEEQLLNVAAHLAQVAFERDHLLQAGQQARRERDENAALLDAFFDTAPAGFAFFDTQLRFQRLNPAMAALTGHPTEAHRGRSVAELLPGFPDASQPLEAVLSSGEALSDVLITGETLAAPGVTRSWNERFFPVRDAAGTILGLGAIVNDVTDQLRAQQAQKHSEDRFRSLVEASVHVVWTTDPQGSVTDRLPTWEVFSNVTHEQLKGFGWLDTLHPEDRPQTLALWEQAVHSRSLYEAEYRLRRADGVYRLMLARGVPVLETDGTIREWVGSCTDITERRQTEAQVTRLAQIVEASSDFIGIASLSGEALYVNRSGRDLLGLGEGEVAGTAVIDYFSAQEQPWVREVALPTLFEQGRFQSDAHFQHFQSGELVAVNWNLFLIRDSATGEPTGIATVSRDIRERKQIEEALREQTEILGTLNRINEVISGELDRERLVQAVTDAGVELTGAQFGAFFYNFVNERQETYILYALSGAPHDAFAGYPMPRNTRVFGPTFAGEGVIRVGDITQDPRYGHNAPYQGMPPGHLPVRSYLAVPVISRSGEVLGGLFFGHAEADVFSERAEQLAVGLAAQTAVALDNARLYQQLQDSHAQLERRVEQRTGELEAQAMSLDAFAAFAEAVGTETDVRVLAQQAITVLLTRFPTDTIGYYEPAEGLWKLQAWTEDIETEVLEVLKRGLSAETPSIAQVLNTHAAVFVNAWDADRERIEGTETYAAAGGYPVVVDGVVKGILSIGRRKTREWTERDKALFSAVGRSFTLALERASQTTHIQEQRDALEARSQALEAFALLTRDLSVDVDPLALVRRAQEILMSLLPEGYTLYWQPDGAHWVSRSQVGPLGHPELQGVVDAGLPRGQAATLDRAWQTRQAVYEDPYPQGADTRPEVVAHVRAAAMLPVVVNGELHGMIGVGLFVQRRWARIDRAVLETVTRSLGLALEGAESARALQERTQELERSNSELEKFAYVASHDLQEPLRTISSFSELINRRYGEVLDERGQQYLHFVSSGAQRMKGLIDDLLVFSRLNAVPDPHSLLKLEDPVQEALQRLHAALEESGAVVRYGSLPRVSGSPTELTQLFQNLIGNSVKFRRENAAPVIEIAATLEGEMWHVTVQDNGIGFEPHYAERVFQIFQRLHTRDEYDGTGMGLAIVRRILEHHGGRIWVESEPGVGSTFHFMLPVAPAN